MNVVRKGEKRRNKTIVLSLKLEGLKSKEITDTENF